MAMYNSSSSAFITNKSKTGVIVIKCVGITEDTVNVSVYSHILSYTSLVPRPSHPSICTASYKCWSEKAWNW